MVWLGNCDAAEIKAPRGACLNAENLYLGPKRSSLPIFLLAQQTEAQGGEVTHLRPGVGFINFFSYHVVPTAVYIY